MLESRQRAPLAFLRIAAPVNTFAYGQKKRGRTQSPVNKALLHVCAGNREQEKAIEYLQNRETSAQGSLARDHIPRNDRLTRTIVRIGIIELTASTLLRFTSV